MQELTRYVDPAILELWSDQQRVIIHREIWQAVWLAQASCGITEYSDEIRDALVRAQNDVDLESIRRRERKTRHDVKASLEEYLHVAAVPEVLHLGMTSADVVDNMSLIQMAMSAQYMGMLTGDAALLGWQHWIPFRGIVGPMGTAQDQLDLMDGDEQKLAVMQERIAREFGFESFLMAPAQVYQRSIDLAYATQMFRLATADRACHLLASGFIQMISGYCGQQWNEGDVSTSVVRRVALPGITFAASVAVRGALTEEANRATEESNSGKAGSDPARYDNGYA